MAGLSAAARARQLGARPRVLEKGARPGGSMLLSSCVVWRYRAWEDYRSECPGADRDLQYAIWHGLDERTEWLEELGAAVVEHSTGNPRTVGKRFDPRSLTDALVRAAGEILLERPAGALSTPTILATGGFQGSPALIAEHIAPAAPLRLRANPWSAGDGLELALGHGAALSEGMDEFYGRNMPDGPFAEHEFVPLAQLYGRFARVVNDRGEEFFDREVSWSETDLVQATARQPRARAWYLLDDAALAHSVRGRPVAAIAASASTATDPATLPFSVPSGTRIAVRVSPGITHTIGGLRIDARARVLAPDGSALDGLYAAGVDAGGFSTGGYASGLAAALVLGCTAAETALAAG